MRQGIFSNALSGLWDKKEGEQFRSIFSYFVPEFITNLVIYSMPMLLDAWFICELRSAETFVALESTNTFLHLIIKIAESFAVGTVIIVGMYNGAGEYTKVGRTLRDAFWTTIIIGALAACFLAGFAREIYAWHGLEQSVIDLSVPFMQLRAIGVFFMFAYFAFVGFLRGIKNTRVPMYIFMLGMGSFILCDYILIFGKYGFPVMGLQGSAIATIVQYAVMLCAALVYTIKHPDNKKYAISLFSSWANTKEIAHLIRVSVPVIMDKAIMAMSYIWLCRSMATLGTQGVAAFSAVKNLERFALIPAIACAQVITFLVSNNIGAHRWSAVKTNCKRLLFIASIGVGVILTLFTCFPRFFLSFFDKNDDFISLATRAFPLLSVLAYFDLLQLVLSGALRGTGNVRVVMITRFCICFLFFIPVSWVITHIEFNSTLLQFLLIYGSFYIGNALMSIVYIQYFRADLWKKRALAQEGL